MSRMAYVVPLMNLRNRCARAARYYRFDRKLYLKVHGGFHPTVHRYTDNKQCTMYLLGYDIGSHPSRCFGGCG
jgi:hypothetical protein